MKSFVSLGLVFALCIFSTARGNDVTPSPSFYWYGTISKANIETIRKSVTPSQIVVAKEKSQRRFWKPWIVDTSISYIFRSASSTLPPELEALAFKPLARVRVVGYYARVSDINGWGTQVNGEVHRRSTTTDDYEMGPEAEAHITQSLQTPFTSLEKMSPGDFKNVFDVGGSIPLERAYYVFASTTVSTTDSYTDASIEIVKDDGQTPHLRAGYVPTAVELGPCSYYLSSF